MRYNEHSISCDITSYKRLPNTKCSNLHSTASVCSSTYFSKILLLLHPLLKHLLPQHPLFHYPPAPAPTSPISSCSSNPFSIIPFLQHPAHVMREFMSALSEVQSLSISPFLTNENRKCVVYNGSSSKLKRPNTSHKLVKKRIERLR